MRKKILLFAFILPALYLTQGLANDLLQKGKLWTAIPCEGALSENKKFQYYLEPQLRFISRSESFDQGGLHLGVGYKSIPTLTVWLGGTYSVTHNVDTHDAKQYRIWQQISWDALNTPCLEIDTRTRFEQRFEEHEPGTALRLRQKIAFTIPTQKDFAWVITEELFFNLNNPTWVNHQLIDQNRAFFGIAIPLSKSAHLETGYLNQYMLRTRDQMNHVLNLSLKVKN